MTKQDILRKISSRKFWAAITAFVTSLLTAFNIADTVQSQILTIVAGVGALAIYMLAEAHADNGRNKGDE